MRYKYIITVVNEQTQSDERFRSYKSQLCPHIVILPENTKL